MRYTSRITFLVLRAVAVCAPAKKRCRHDRPTALRLALMYDWSAQILCIYATPPSAAALPLRLHVHLPTILAPIAHISYPNSPHAQTVRSPNA